ncbi:hypothetical protein LCGC14_0368450 [marine sediment metagenome]|uniref:Uncharacterized protein n=1 Tax=marine sediment metagenome TaxID=412755 RepID=A0A0F9WEF5_9ZZZZ
MGIVNVLSQEILDNWGTDARKLLSLYESVYPPDLAIKMGEDPGTFDFDIFGGDLGVAGFYVNPSYESIIQLATQDLLIRIMTDRNQSRLFPSVGNVNIARIPREGITSAIAVAASDSPFIATLNSVDVRITAIDEVYIQISATTPTGDSLSVGFKF